MTPYIWKWLTTDDLVPFWIVGFLIVASLQPLLLYLVAAWLILESCCWTLCALWGVGQWLWSLGHRFIDWWTYQEPPEHAPILPVPRPMPRPPEDPMLRLARETQEIVNKIPLLPLHPDEVATLQEAARRRMFRKLRDRLDNAL